MNVGFIGTGSMGTILIESFIESGALLPDDITANNRTRTKVERLAAKYPGLCAAESNIDVVLDSDIVFVCVKPLEYKRVLDEIRDAASPSLILVSITSPIQVRHLEEQLPCKIAKVIPSITNYKCSGASLTVYSQRMTASDRDLLDNLLRQISMPLPIDETHTRVTSDISSCGPAFLSYFLQQFVEAAVEETGIPKEHATRLAAEMLLGTGMLLTCGGFTPETLQQRVSVPGGITEQGLRLLHTELNGVFNQLIRTTHAKYTEDLEKVEAMFHGTKTTK